MIKFNLKKSIDDKYNVKWVLDINGKEVDFQTTFTAKPKTLKNLIAIAKTRIYQNLYSLCKKGSLDKKYVFTSKGLEWDGENADDFVFPVLKKTTIGHISCKAHDVKDTPIFTLDEALEYIKKQEA